MKITHCIQIRVYNIQQVWHSVDDTDIEQFVEIDKYLLRGLTEAHAKSPVKHLYLETAALPVPYIISENDISTDHLTEA